MAFHGAGAADRGRRALENALPGEAAALLYPSVTRHGERRVVVAFGVLADSAADAIGDARALLLAALVNVRPVPLWLPDSMTAEPAPELATDGSACTRPRG